MNRVCTPLEKLIAHAIKAQKEFESDTQREIISNNKECTMKIDIKRAVSENRNVKFRNFQNGIFYYETEFEEVFPVPLEDLAGADLIACDKALLFMRYMRAYNKSLDQET